MNSIELEACASSEKDRLTTPLKIGSLELHSRVFQSPLSGVTDLVFRRSG